MNDQNIKVNESEVETAQHEPWTSRYIHMYDRSSKVQSDVDVISRIVQLTHTTRPSFPSQKECIVNLLFKERKSS